MPRPTASTVGGAGRILAVLVLLAGCSREEDSATFSNPSGAREAGEPEAPAAPVDPPPSAGDRLEAVPGVEAVDFTRGLRAVLDALDPGADAGWDSEVFSEAALRQLDGLARTLEAGGSPPGDLLDPAYEGTDLRPASLGPVHEGPWMRVLRGEAGASNAGFEGAIEALMAPFEGARDRHVKFKLYRTDRAGDGPVTRVLYQASGERNGGIIQQNAEWRCSWSGDVRPRLRRVEVTRFEEIQPVTGVGLRFRDETVALLGAEPAYLGQLSRGVDHWRGRLQGDFGVDVNGLQGLAIGDANGDGLEDLYVCQQGGLPNRLFLRRANGSLRDHSAASGTDWMELTRAALFVDLDNDGDQDLALAQGWYLMLMENDGTGRFTRRVELPAEAQFHSLAAADPDGDGDLDLYFCGRNPARERAASEGVLGMPMPYHDANNAGPNVLLANEGGWRFADVTAALGLDVNNRRYSYACAWEDYDNDGDPDLYVANDFGRNNLYRNDLDRDGRFVDVAAAAGVEDLSAGMSVTWGDADRDGRVDLYVSNMFSAAGNRIAYQRRFGGGGVSAEGMAGFRRHARGNSLFLNRGGDGTFTDASEAWAVSMGRWAWGARFADLDNDGWEDLYVANGFITAGDTGDL